MSVELSQYAQHMPLEKGQIRLLTLRQGSNQDDLIECELSSCELNSAPAYEALSYYWGTTESDRVISLHGSQFRVRDDLYKALQHLRHGQTSRVLWIDWICIDQRNQAEIYEQISQLGEICAKAETVVVYLGEATDATDQAMDYLMQIQEGETSQISPGIMDNVVLEGCQDILSRPWFQRAWILQDAFYARAAVLHCGSKAVLSKTMIYISKSISDKIDPLSQHVLNLMPGSRGDDEAASKIPLYDLLQRFRFSKATDQRDKIYALLGIVGFEPPKSIILPDYSMSQKDLMRAVLAHLCFCEPSSVPEPPYETIDEFLANLDPIDNDILKKMFETSRDIDLVSLLRHGSHYISIDRSLVEAAGRNKTKGDEMAKILRAAIDSKRSAVPTSPEVS